MTTNTTALDTSAPACPTCGRDDHPVIGACQVCGLAVYRDCEGDVLHVDYADEYTREHGDHAPRYPRGEAPSWPAEGDPLTLDTRALRTATRPHERGAARALTALQAYAPLGGRGRSLDEIIRDLYTDLLHLADAVDVDGNWQEIAHDAYTYEKN